ncbi:MAG: hypothetical protein Q9225_004825 [Loekoesia sp. 1 TL-2023]
MLRLRRSRLFLVLAVFTVIALYHFTSFGSLRNGDGSRVEDLKTFASKDASSKPATDSTAATDGSTASPVSVHKDPITKDKSDDSSDTDRASDEASPSPTSALISDDLDKESDSSTKKENEVSSKGEDVEEPQTLQNITKSNEEPDVVAQSPAEPVLDTSTEAHGDGRFEVIAGPDDGMPKIHWSRLPEHFPVPTKSLIPLPTGKPNAIPKIQFSKFPDESSDQKVEREAKLDRIKKTFAFSWDGYRKNAWMHDELSPVSGNYRNPFCGWAATLVDSLDSLWMLGMKQEFEEAVEAVGKIDFTTSIRNDLPLFEVTIRYLGGLVAAYDISGSKYRKLLDKAVELAEVLMGAFDTPNHMPMTYYLWKPTFASQPHRAKTRVVLAEIGSLSLEFTRLAQITKEAKYYDAIARITNEFERWQNNTKIPGLWPKQVDASGCKKPETSYISPVGHSAQKGPGFYNEQSPQIPESSKTTGSSKEADSELDKLSKKAESESETAAEGSEHRVKKRQPLNTEPAIENTKPKADCVAQGLSSPPGTSWEDFTIGGMADSIYEYLPKEYLLLGGLEKKYQSMYELAAEATVKNLIFRPMIEDEERNILVAGQISITGKSQSNLPTRKLKPEQAHLTCFAGGMFAFGARIFDRKDDMDIAKRLTDGCVWAYEMTPTGIMPEHFLITPCDDMKKCPFNETLWYEKLDPYHPRTRSRAYTQQTPLDDSKESSAQAAAKVGKTEMNATDTFAAHEGTNSTKASTSALNKRQLGDIENDKLIQADKEKKDKLEAEPKLSEAATAKQKSGTGSDDEDDLAKDEQPAKEGADTPAAKESATPTSAEGSSEPVAPAVEAYTPPPIPSQEEYAKGRIRDEKLPKGVMKITGSKYILRPEALESVFIMYRVTGDDYWRTKGWNMFTSIQNYTRTEYGASAISDVMSETPYPLDEMESFWLGETLKYLYLLFSEPDYYSLDDYVANSEAHFFKRPK